MTGCKSARQAPHPNLVLKLGFCVDRAGEQRLIAHGIPERLIWMRGRGAEGLGWCKTYFRGRPGIIAVADDLRIFGTTQKAILGELAELHKAGITVLDIEHGDNPHELVAMALRAVHAASGVSSKRVAKRRGRKGGIGKGEAAKAARVAADPHGLIGKIVNDREISWRIKERLLKDVCSIATARRHYYQPGSAP